MIGVVGNSHFHLPMVDLISTFGGACIAHDDRMFEVFVFDRGKESTGSLFGAPDDATSDASIDSFTSDLDTLPFTGYQHLASAASPLIVHSAALANRIDVETGFTPSLVPFVPYNVPAGPVGADHRKRARKALGLRDDVVHLATFGAVDTRTKCTNSAIVCASWLRDWGVPAHLHVVGPIDPLEAEELEEDVRELEFRRQGFRHRPYGAPDP